MTRLLMICLLMTAFGTNAKSQSDQVMADNETLLMVWEEKFRQKVSACWLVASGSEAAEVSVTLAFTLRIDGKIKDDIRMIASSAGKADAVEDAFQAARRAILRCQGDGFEPLPLREPRDQAIEIVFGPATQTRPKSDKHQSAQPAQISE